MENELKHHGVLGMKWGVRRYQPYSTTGPRKGGKTGKEVGEARATDAGQDNGYGGLTARQARQLKRTDRYVRKQNRKETVESIKKGAKIVAGLTVATGVTLAWLNAHPAAATTLALVTAYGRKRL